MKTLTKTFITLAILYFAINLIQGDVPKTIAAPVYKLIAYVEKVIYKLESVVFTLLIVIGLILLGSILRRRK